MIDPASLRKLVGRAHDCLTAARASLDDNKPEHAHDSIRTAYDILAYIEAKRLLASPGSEANPSTSSYV